MNANIKMQGRFVIRHLDRHGNLKQEIEVPNGIVNVGVNHLLDVGFRNQTQEPNWYIGLINNAGFTALNNSDTMASHSGWAETSAYSEPDRPAWAPGAATGRSITNGTPVDFSINATVTIRGIFITSDDTKGGSTGVLWSTAQFAAPVSAVNGDTLKVTYTING